MCGLVAIYKNSERPMQARVLEEMTNTLIHRGPDDYGFSFINPNSDISWREKTPKELTGRGVALGHRRLSIIDLSSAGRQPFFSQDRQLCLVFNGEIFNYIELRSELKSLGYRFNTNTDTEVLLNAFQHWGPASFNRLNGMWAVVFWDNRTKQLIACRDRFGIKPLFYGKIKEDWVFASEIKAILRYPQCKHQPNASSVMSFLYTRFKPRPGVTFFEGIDELEPGHYLTIQDASVRKLRYWNLSREPRHNNGRFVEKVEELRHLIDDSVKLRLRSDVKIGTMLSGGIDSTSIISTVHKALPPNMQTRAFVGRPIQAFHASFPELPTDEQKNVELICKALNLAVNYVFPMQEENIIDLFQTALQHMEVPFHNPVPMVHSLLMRSAKANGVTVVLNGHGADEMFAGYPADYAPLALHDMLVGFNWIDAYRHINEWHRNYHASRVQLIKEAIELVVPRVLLKRRHQQDHPELRHAAAIPYPGTGEKRPFKNKLDYRLRRDFSRRILPNWLHMEDKISMASSIEARIPFLDYRLVEFAFSLDATAKMQRGLSKYILRQAMRDRLPREIVEDTRKVPFSGPEKFWLQNPLKDMLAQLLNRRDVRVGEFVDPKLLQQRLHSFFKEGRSLDAPLIWRAFSAEMWLQKFIG